MTLCIELWRTSRGTCAKKKHINPYRKRKKKLNDVRRTQQTINLLHSLLLSRSLRISSSFPCFFISSFNKYLRPITVLLVQLVVLFVKLSSVSSLCSAHTYHFSYYYWTSAYRQTSIVSHIRCIFDSGAEKMYLKYLLKIPPSILDFISLIVIVSAQLHRSLYECKNLLPLSELKHNYMIHAIVFDCIELSKTKFIYSFCY